MVDGRARRGRARGVQRVERAVRSCGIKRRRRGPQAAATGRSRCGRAPAPVGRRSARSDRPASLYRRGAHPLEGLGEVAAERAAFDAYRPGFERFLGRFDTPLADPVLRPAWTPGASAWTLRGLHADRHLRPVQPAASARGSSADVEADYKSGDIYNRMVRFVEQTKRAARRHWGSVSAALEAARDRLIELGANDGYATFFAFGQRGSRAGPCGARAPGLEVYARVERLESTITSGPRSGRPLLRRQARIRRSSRRTGPHRPWTRPGRSRSAGHSCHRIGHVQWSGDRRRGPLVAHRTRCPAASPT